jgi:hypothetical protein
MRSFVVMATVVVALLAVTAPPYTHHHHHHQVAAWSSDVVSRTTTTMTMTTRSSSSSSSSSSYRHYFAIGSNMVPSTMTCLRNLSPRSATAAILPDYRLAFDIGTTGDATGGRSGGGGGGGGIQMEPSAASVQSCPGAIVHGVLYELDMTDFVALSASEGVPWVYRWQNCRVIPYRGDGATAGITALQEWKNAVLLRGGDDDTPNDTSSVSAVVLAKSQPTQGGWPFPFSRKTRLAPKNSNRRNDDDIPPSQSYLEILQRGARLWKMDVRYQTELANIKTAVGVNGVSGLVLAVAELCNPRTDMDLLPKD